MLESATVAARVSLGRLGYSPAPTRAVIPCSKTCLTRKFLFGILRSRGVPLSFGYCKWEIFSLYLLRFFFFSLLVICFCDSFLPNSVLLCFVTGGSVPLV